MSEIKENQARMASHRLGQKAHKVQWRQCEALSPGTYEAEIKNDVVWIYAFGGTRPLKIKYRVVDPALFGINHGPKN
jgi:hypothetical protein